MRIIWPTMSTYMVNPPSMHPATLPTQTASSYTSNEIPRNVSEGQKMSVGRHGVIHYTSMALCIILYNIMLSTALNIVTNPPPAHIPPGGAAWLLSMATWWPLWTPTGLVHLTSPSGRWDQDASTTCEGSLGTYAKNACSRILLNAIQAGCNRTMWMQHGMASDSNVVVHDGVMSLTCTP